MNGKNHNPAFTLIEVLIAVAVLGIIATSVYTLLQVSIQADVRGAARVQRVLLLKNVLNNPELIDKGEAKKEDKARREITIKDPPTRITITQAGDKQLARYQHLKPIHVQANWEWLWVKDEESLTLYQWQAPEEKKNEKKG